MVKFNLLSLLLILSASPFSASAADPESLDLQPISVHELYTGFQNPPAEARPFVRWWWNNNQVETEEALRELDILKAAGFGGVEINPILDPALSWERKKLSEAPILRWGSPEWNQVLKEVSQGAKERGMIVDLLGGSGWPFGSRALPESEQMQRVSTFEKAVTGPDTFRITRDKLFSEKRDYGRRTYQKKPKNPELLWVWIFPESPDTLDRIREIPVPDQGPLSIDIPKGPHRIVFAVKETEFRYAGNAVAGSGGPAIDHMQTAAIQSFMDEILAIESDWKQPLSSLIRAIFCDSLELAESNWTHDILETFLERKGYDIRPWLPLVIRSETDAPPVDPAFRNQVRRARYDWMEHNATLVKERFMRPFTQISHEHGLLSRLQTYGNPYYMDMPGGYLIPDIPEGNNVIYAYRTSPTDEDFFTWKHSQGYMAWNKYASAGARLRGKRIASAESMTNVLGFFQTTLATVKQADDLNFITGINHSILHGYNYTPPDMDFPGFIRFGTFFSEHNPWWPQLQNWAVQNGRLSFVFQNSQPQNTVALLGPTSDVWGRDGLEKDAFNNTPSYVHRLWEPLSQLGIGCDYLHEAVIAGADTTNGKLRVGPMSYEVLLIADAQTLLPETAEAIAAFADSGGRVIFVGKTPNRSPGLAQAAANDRRVKQAIQQALQKGARKVPAPGSDLRKWMQDMLASVETPLRIVTPDDGLYSLHQRCSDAEILFFTNSRRANPVQTSVRFSLPSDRGWWRWDPENGRSSPYPSTAEGFDLDLRPLESILLVSGPANDQAPSPTYRPVAEIKGPWTLHFSPVNHQQPFEIQMKNLEPFETHSDPRVKRFAGQVDYQKPIRIPEGATHLDLGDTREMTVEVILNGHSLGTQWAAQTLFDLRPALQPGDNQLILRCQSTLFNGMIGTEAFNRLWNKFRRNETPSLQPMGLKGPIRFLSE